MGHRNARTDRMKHTAASPDNFNAGTVSASPGNLYATAGTIVLIAATRCRQFVLIRIIRIVRTVGPEPLASPAR